MIGFKLGIADHLPFAEWLDKVIHAPDVSAGANPAKKLEEFLRLDFERMACGHVLMGTDETRRVSSTLGDMDAVSSQVIASYVQYWRDIRFLS